MLNIKETIEKIKSTLYVEEFHRYRIELTDGYMLSVLTASHFNSTELGTVEVALIKDNEFVYGFEDSDKSIIHYMNYETFVQFIQHIYTAYEDNLSKYYQIIFDLYKREE